jgi:carboxylesterase
LPANYPAWGIRLFSFFQTYRKKSKGAPGEGWFDKDAFQGHVSYPLNPIRSAAELQTMLGRMRLALPKINVPVLLIHSKDDPYVPPDSMPNIYERLDPSRREMLWVTGSGHVVTRDAARQQVFEAAAAFIQKIGNQSL